MPAAAVMKIQRKAPDLFPACAIRTPMSMVKLLEMRTNVINMTLMMLGEKLKGRGQSGVALRKNP